MTELQKKELLLLKIIIIKGPSHGSGQWNNSQNASYRTISYSGQDSKNRGRSFNRRSKHFLNRNEENRSNIGNYSIQNGTWRNNGFFLVHQQDQDGALHTVFRYAHLNLFNLEIHLLEDQTVIQPIVPPLTNKNFRKVATKHQRKWFASPPLMIAITNYENSVR